MSSTISEEKKVQHNTSLNRYIFMIFFFELAFPTVLFFCTFFFLGCTSCQCLTYKEFEKQKQRTSQYLHQLALEINSNSSTSLK